MEIYCINQKVYELGSFAVSDNKMKSHSNFKSFINGTEIDKHLQKEIVSLMLLMMRTVDSRLFEGKISRE